MVVPEISNPDDEETREHDIIAFDIFLSEPDDQKEIEKKRRKKINKMRKEFKKKLPSILEKRLLRVIFQENTFHHLEAALIPIENSERMKRLIEEIKHKRVINSEGKLDIDEWVKICDRELLPLLSSIYTLEELSIMVHKGELNGTLHSFERVKPHCFIVTKDGYLVTGIISREYLNDPKNPQNVSCLDLYDYFNAMQSFIKKKKSFKKAPEEDKH